MKDELTLKDFYYLLIFLFISLLVVISGGGADFIHYLKWNEYFSTYDLTTFSEYPKSKNGLPLVAWYYGIGLITSLITKLFFIKGLILVKLCSSILVVLNFYLIYRISNFYKIQKFSFLFLISLIYLTLPAGYYLNKFSSETWTITLSLLSIYLIEKNISNNERSNNLDLIIFGIVMYFLTLVKITNIFLCFSLIFIFYVKKYNNIYLDKNNIFKNLRILSFSLLFVIISIFLLSIYHKLLIGSFLASPYSYGNGEFSSFSIKNFKILEVFFSSWHGLVFYHPIYVFSFLLLLNSIYKNLFKKENIKWIMLTTFFLFLTHILIQSSHATWWMGLGTYGARGFAGISILSFYIFLSIQDKMNINNINLAAKLLVICFLGYQSFILSLGVTNFYDLDTFISFFFTTRSYIALSAVLSIIISCFIIKQFFKMNFLNFLKTTTIFLAFNSAIQIFSSVEKSYYVFLILILISYFISYLFLNNFDKINEISKKYFPTLSSVFFIILFFYSIYGQANLFIEYKKETNRSFFDGKNFDCREAIGSYVEYDNIKSHYEEKKIWLKFLKQSGCI